MVKKHYIRSDGNGGISLSNSIAIVMSILVFLGMVVPSAIAYGVLNNKVTNLEDTWNEAGPKYGKVIQEIEDNAEELEDELADHNINQARIEERLTSIDENLEEIKAEIKDLKRQTGGGLP